MTNSPHLQQSLHDTYRDRLNAWGNDAAFAPHLQAVGARRGWWGGDGRWVRTYGRFFPGAAPAAVIVFALVDHPATLCVIEAFDAPPKPEHDDHECLLDADLGWLRFGRFPVDKRLPGLATVLGDAAATSGRVDVLRYRPRKRCTLRVDHSSEQGSSTRFAKVFPDDRGRRIYEESEAIWQASQEIGGLSFAVAKSERWDSATHTLWQHKVVGAPLVDQMASADAPHLARRIGAAAGEIAISRLRPQQSFSRDDQLSDTEDDAAEIVRRVPWLAGAVGQLIEGTARIHERVAARPLVPIHGAPHLHQWLLAGERLGLVDFDGFTFGDPELDVATFVSEIDFSRRDNIPCGAIRAAFIDGYELVAGALDRDLLRAYCTHKRLSKTLKYVQAIHPNGDLRGEQAIGRALVCLFDGDKSLAE